MAYEAGTIEKPELAGVLQYLMSSPQMYSFWTKVRAARVAVTSGDPGEDFFTAEVDTAYRSVSTTGGPGTRTRRRRTRRPRLVWR